MASAVLRIISRMSSGFKLLFFDFKRLATPPTIPELAAVVVTSSYSSDCVFSVVKTSTPGATISTSGTNFVEELAPDAENSKGELPSSSVDPTAIEIRSGFRLEGRPLKTPSYSGMGETMVAPSMYALRRASMVLVYSVSACSAVKRDVIFSYVFCRQSTVFGGSSAG